MSLNKSRAVDATFSSICAATSYHMQNREFCCVCRPTGRPVFRRTLLAKQGKLVLIHDQLLSCSVADLAEYVQWQVEAVTGDSLTADMMS